MSLPTVYSDTEIEEDVISIFYEIQSYTDHIRSNINALVSLILGERSVDLKKLNTKDLKTVAESLEEAQKLTDSV